MNATLEGRELDGRRSDLTMWVGATLCVDVFFRFLWNRRRATNFNPVTNIDVNVVGARSSFVCNAVMLFSSAPKT